MTAMKSSIASYRVASGTLLCASLIILVLLATFLKNSATLRTHHDFNSVSIGNLCLHADDFYYCKSYIGKLVSKTEGNGTQPYLRRTVSGSRRRQLDETPIQNDEHDFNFYLFNITGATISVGLVAVISAMFLGYLTLDPLDLRIKMRASLDPTEKEAATCIYPLVNQNHRLMVTLLVMNSLAYECLPLFLDKLLPTWMTIIFSVTLLLVFGEVRIAIPHLLTIYSSYMNSLFDLWFHMIDYPHSNIHWTRPIDVGIKVSIPCEHFHDNTSPHHLSPCEAS